MDIRRRRGAGVDGCRHGRLDPVLTLMKVRGDEFLISSPPASSEDLSMIDFQTLKDLSGGAAEVDSTCPLCSAGRKSFNRNKKVLRIWNKEPGFATYKCMHCDASGSARDGGNNGYTPHESEDRIAKALMAAIGKPAPRVLDKTYDYVDADGTLLYQKLRYIPKFFTWRRPDGNGGWIEERGDRVVPYRLPDLLQYPDGTIFLCEGEKDADRVASLGHCATNVAQGDLDQEKCAAYIAGRDVIILKDNDNTGIERASKAARSLHGNAKTIRIVGMPGAKDVSEWLDLDAGNAGKLTELCFDAPLWEPSPELPPQNDAKIEKSIAAALGLQKRVAQPQSGAPGAEGKAVVALKAGELHKNAIDAEAGLVAANVPLYIHGEAIVRPIVDDAPGFHGTKTKVARLRILSAHDLRRILAEHVQFERFDMRQKKYVVVNPPGDLVETILARDGEWQFPRLRGIITTPTLRRDGTILSEIGYDRASGLLLACQPLMPAMPEKPTQDNAREALSILLGVLAEFPFVSDADRSVALSILITPVVRGGMMVAPLHAATAPTRGTGKSYLFDTAAAIATGERCPVINAGRNEEETEKRLGAELMSGQPIILVDNLNGDFSGDFLCSAIERPVVKPRVLGRSENKRIENHSTFFANGNNLRLVGDVVRRAVTCSLDANMERPELRQFRGNPVAAILSDRGRYVAACLTVVRAYLEAGCPNPCPTLASFDDWSRLVRSALVWLGCTDPCDTMDKSMVDDPTVATKRAIVAAWVTAIGLDRPMKTGDLIRKATDLSDPDMTFSKSLSSVACLPGRIEIDALRLAKWLNRNRDNIVDGLKIQSTVDSHSKQQVWWVTQLAGGA
jgi:putative DNA primase/helicase